MVNGLIILYFNGFVGDKKDVMIMKHLQAASQGVNFVSVWKLLIYGYYYAAICRFFFDVLFLDGLHYGVTISICV